MHRLICSFIIRILQNSFFLQFSPYLTRAVLLWHQNGVCSCLACASGLCRSHHRGWVVIRCNRAKTAQQYLLCTKRQNRPRRFHALVEFRQGRRTPVVHLLGEPPRDPNQSSAPPVMDYKCFTSGKAKETRPESKSTSFVKSQCVFKYCHEMSALTQIIVLLYRLAHHI